MEDGEELWVCDELDGRRLQEQGDLLVADRGGRALSPGLWVTGQDRAMEVTTQRHRHTVAPAWRQSPMSLTRERAVILAAGTYRWPGEASPPRFLYCHSSPAYDSHYPPRSPLSSVCFGTCMGVDMTSQSGKGVP